MVKIVYNKLLGGWYIVRGPHQAPIAGRFDSKAEAKQWLVDQQAKRDNRVTYRRVA
jgi:DNA repair ATPase RecN